MGKNALLTPLAIALALSLMAAIINAQLDVPHNSINSVGCENCHFPHNTTEKFLNISQGEQQNIDDTPVNNLCWSCHNDIVASYVRTHSSLQTDDDYGNWSMECRQCHWPHQQMQFRTYGGESYLYSNTSTSITGTTLTKTGAAWTAGQYKDSVLIPNIAEGNYNYKITGNTNDTLTIAGPMDLTRASTGDTFAIVYGKLIKSTLPTPNSGSKQVKFFGTTGNNSFADGDSTYNGVCEACHTKTDHFRNNGSGSDQLHTNVGGTAGTNCISCHPHENGFGHGSGSGSAGCVSCHGHEAGTLYDSDMSEPYIPGINTSQGRGTTTPHSTHTEIDADDKRGPGIYCDTCHDITNFPKFKSGTDANGDGMYNLSETDVCDTCHSPNGSYNGVSSIGGSVGAKDNWNSEGVYNNTANLMSGKGKWCAGCHDENSSVIQNVSAPNVIGDEGALSTYGTGYGFYKTGHGLPSNETYPETGGVVAGAGKYCGTCHNSSLGHIDGNARTFDCGDGCNSTEYRQSYRLKFVDGQDPMNISLPPGTTPLNDASLFRLCYGCHDPEPFLNSSNNDTNLKTDGVNRHEYHLNLDELRYPADYNYSSSYNSRITCVVCHNVHGSTKLAMVRNGKLIDRELGLMIWYNNDDIVSYSTSSSDPPVPENLPLSASTGTVWRSATASNLCTHCHNNNNVLPEYRTPFQNVTQAPQLAWTGEANYTTGGVNPNSAEGSADFVFRINYSDPNNDVPTMIQVWVDEDDNSTYAASEKYNMTAVDPSDTNYVDNKIYTKSLILVYAGDGAINYTFYASDGTNDATGTPTNDSMIAITACSSDTDGDYVCDANDNCPNDANSDQADSDNDGVGNVCDLTPFAPAVAGGGYHSIALKSDGTVWAWGNNTYGQLGDGTTTQRTTPVQVSGLTNITAIAAGMNHGLAVADNGSVWSWGRNNIGQLGDGTTTQRTTPVQVSGLTDVTAVAAGESHSLALKKGGTVWSWGEDGDGQLGNNGTGTTDQYTPVQVVDQNDKGLTGVTAIAAGSYHSLAVKSDGTVWGWGNNNKWQIGDAARTFQVNLRASQIAGLENITAIAGSLYHSLFVENNGSVWGLGDNDYGQLGDGTLTSPRTTPVQAVNNTNVTAIASRGFHTLTLKSNGTVWTYGYNDNGQLGNGVRDWGKYSTAVQTSTITNATAIGAGWLHSLAVKDNGTVSFWAGGDNAYGQMGIGTTSDYEATPVQVQLGS